MKLLNKVLVAGSLALSSVMAQTNWTDISTTKVNTLGTQSYPGGVAGTCVNRLTGDVFIDIVGFGIFRSTNQGAAWTSYSGNTLSGRCENGWGVQVCQDDPTKMAVFSLDGDAGYTLNGGTSWKKFTQVWGRNWDYGSVDWANPAAKTIMAMDHENGGHVRVSTDGGTTWTLLSITLSTDVWGSGPMTIGVMDSTTLIHSTASGIQRSTDLGATWTQVSTEKPMGKVAVLFKGKHYLGTATGLIVSADKGLTWQHQSVSIYQGPYFGADENVMVVAGSSGIQRTVNGGTTWTKIGDYPTVSSQGFGFNVLWFGGNAWDPVNNLLYATAMANPAFKKAAPTMPVTTALVPRQRAFGNASQGLRLTGTSLASDAPFTLVQIFSLAGALVYESRTAPVNEVSLPAVYAANQFPCFLRVTSAGGVVRTCISSSAR